MTEINGTGGGAQGADIDDRWSVIPSQVISFSSVPKGSPEESGAVNSILHLGPLCPTRL